jgi:hypothetical protein
LLKFSLIIKIALGIRAAMIKWVISLLINYLMVN